jgi:hypothetical protein
MMIIPLISTSLYLIFSYILNIHSEYFNNLYITNKNYKNTLKNISILHNFGLIIFSLYTFETVKNMVLLKYNSLDPQIYLKDIILEHSWKYIFWYFTYSKIWEFFDTYLLQLRGIKPIFLQKFHHYGAVWVWYLGTYFDSNAIILPTLFNSFVHTIMYSYYLITLFGLKFNLLKQFITILQILQLIFGSVFIILYNIPNLNYNDPKLFCSSVFVFYVFILIILFIDFFRKTYFGKIKK